MNEKPLSVDEAYLFIAKSLLERFKEKYNLEEVPMKLTHKVKFSDDGVGYSIENEPDYLPFAIDYGDDVFVSNVEGVSTRIDFLLSKGILEMPKTYSEDGSAIKSPKYESYAPHLISFFLSFPLFHSIINNRTMNLSDGLLLSSFQLYRKYWESNDNNWIILTPLINFTSESDEIYINDSLKIRKFENIEKESYWESLGNMYIHDFVSISDFHHAQYVIEWKQTVAKDFLIDREIEPTIGELISSLRLYQPGTVGARYSIRDNDSPKPRTVGLGVSYLNNYSIQSIHAIHDDYFLKKEDIKTITNIYKLLLDIKSQNKFHSIDVAIRRFNMAYSRKDPEDKIVDISIALESTLLYKLKDELSYRLSMRGASLLTSTHSAIKVKELLSLIYRIRSAIVHEGKSLHNIMYKDKSKSMRELRADIFKYDSNINQTILVESIENITRDILNAYIPKLIEEDNMEVINNSLDNALLDKS